MTATRKSVKTAKTARKAELVVSLALSINHQVYTVTPIQSNDDEIVQAWQLAKRGGDGAVHHVADTTRGATCDCADQTFRHEGNDTAGCKHIAALRSVGMLLFRGIVPAVKPEPVPPDPALPWWEQERVCTLCGRTGKGRADRADGSRVCGDCSKREEEEAALRAFYRETGKAPSVAAETPAEFPAPSPAPAVIEAAAAELAPPVEVVAAAPAPFELPEKVDPWDNELPAELWPDDTDADTWELGPEAEPEFTPSAEDLAELSELNDAAVARDHLDQSERLTLAELADRQAAFYRAWGNACGAMFAEAMERVAFQIRLTSATSPDELAVRVEALDGDARQQWFEDGYREGRESCQCHAIETGTFGHHA
jgi:hypothetical protein